VQFNYVAQIARVRFGGTHAEYDRIDPRRCDAMLKPIKNRKDHKAALPRIDALMEAAAGTPEAAELEVLCILVERYEAQAFPMRLPTPLDAIQFAMEQRGYSRADLGRLLGSRRRASEIMKGKRLSVAQIRRLHEAWRIPASEARPRVLSGGLQPALGRRPGRGCEGESWERIPR